MSASVIRRRIVLEIPAGVKQSSLYGLLAEDEELLAIITSLRRVASSFADTVTRTLPSFTDHTIKHMDALWSVADHVLTAAEFSRMTSAESFLLTASFYLHDIGMAYAATEEGLGRIMASPQYKSLMAAAPAGSESDPAIQGRAISMAVRHIHANAALELATNPIPGTSIYLFDSPHTRDAWGQTCGRIGASHHWTLDTVERELGVLGTVPLPGHRKGDLGYVAAVLRVVDYAHINRDRASSIDRMLRPSMAEESAIHWAAQENIDGPSRDGTDLVYRAAAPFTDVNAWWLYYEMLSGLDTEIRAVRRYLERRAPSQGRFSLQGVRGTGSPEEASLYLPTSGFLPIEINLRTGSLERLVQLLAGESLYGPDPMAAVRELIQNARDAVMLKSALASSDFERASLTIPIRVSLKTTSSGPLLEVSDSGVGMDRRVMTEYLISIASDYWSSQFHSDFPTAFERGFRPAGKFGIGFLSVFMLGDAVTVESNRDGGERYRLDLRGVGRRGELRTVRAQSVSGTAVRVSLKQPVAEALGALDHLVRVYAPMLPHSIQVDVDGVVSTIPKGWAFGLDADQFRQWTLRAVGRLARVRGMHAGPGESYHWRVPRRMWRPAYTDGNPWQGEWPEYVSERARLIASFEGISLLSLKGLSIQPIETPGFVGIIDLETAVPDASRQRTIEADPTHELENALRGTRPKIVDSLNQLATKELLIEKLEFLARCSVLYGRETLLESSVPWISVVKLPGEVELVSCATLLSRVRQSRSVFIAFNTGPWTAMRKWVGLELPYSGDRNKEPALVLDSAGQVAPRYYSGPGERGGSVSQLWPDCERAPLFGIALQIVAGAWQMGVETLLSQDGWRLEGATIWGRLFRE
jgi:hypothetical protein